MSVYALAAVADLPRRGGNLKVSPTQRLVLYGLALCAAGSQVPRVSNHHLMQLTGLSERALRENLRRLERLELIATTETGERTLFPPRF